MRTILVVVAMSLARLASAEPEAIPTSSAEPALHASAPSSPAPYSLPWQMRSAVPATVLRVDTSVAPYDAANSKSVTLVSMYTLAYKLTPHFAPFVRLGFVNQWPVVGAPAASFLNPILGGMYGFQFSHGLKLALYLCTALPFGQGGGETPNPAIQAANAAGILARASLDNAMFVPNYFTIIPAWTSRGPRAA